MTRLRTGISNLSKQRITFGTVLNVLGGKCTVKLSGSGAVLQGLTVIGPTPAVGQIVRVDYISGVPIVYTSEAPPAEPQEERLLQRPAPTLPEPPYTPGGVTVINADESVKIENADTLQFFDTTVADLTDGKVGITPSGGGGSLSVGKYGSNGIVPIPIGMTGAKVSSWWAQVVNPDITISGESLVVNSEGMYLLTTGYSFIYRSGYYTQPANGAIHIGVYHPSYGFMGNWMISNDWYLPVGQAYAPNLSGAVVIPCWAGATIQAAFFVYTDPTGSSWYGTTIIELTKLSNQTAPPP